MKTKLILFLAFVLLTMNIVFGAEAQTLSWQTEVVPICQSNLCIEGNPGSWRIAIANTGTDDLLVQRIILADNTGFMFASKTFSEEDQSTIPSGKTATVEIEGLVPPPTRGSSLYYSVSLIANNQLSTGNTKYMKVMQITDIECLGDDYCEDGKVCINLKCLPDKLLANQSNMSSRTMKKSSVGGSDIILIVIAVLLGILIFQLVQLTSMVRHKKK